MKWKVRFYSGILGEFTNFKKTNKQYEQKRTIRKPPTKT